MAHANGGTPEGTVTKGLGQHLRNLKEEEPNGSHVFSRKMVVVAAAVVIGLMVLYLLIDKFGWLVVLAPIVLAALAYVVSRAYRAQQTKKAEEAEKQRIAEEQHAEAEREAADRLEADRLAQEERIAEEQRRDHERQDQERQDRRANIVRLRNQRRRSMVIFVGNQSGDGSKTTTSAYLALTFLALFKGGVPVIIVECRRDSAQGVSKHRLEAAEVTSIREFHAQYEHGDFNNPDGSLSTELVMEALALSEGGVCYLQADIKAPVNDTYGAKEAGEDIDVLRATGAIIIIDSGNNPTDPITIGMANKSSLGVYPTMPTSKSLEMRGRTIEAFKDHVKSGIVSDSISVLSALEPNQSLDMLLELMEPIPDRDRVFVTLFDRYMKDDPVTTSKRDATKVADLSKIMPQNRDEFERMVERLLEIFVSQGEGSSNVRTIARGSTTA